ncbi:uncharacterized [Tachysurus ichikawai]
MSLSSTECCPPWACVTQKTEVRLAPSQCPTTWHRLPLWLSPPEVRADPASLASASSRPFYLPEPSVPQVLWLDETKELIQSSFGPGHGKAKRG